MQIGKLRNKGQIFVKTAGAAADYSIEGSETSIGTWACSARIANYDEKERNQDMVVARNRYRLVFRYDTTLTNIDSNCRILLDGTTSLQVLTAHVDDHNRNRWIIVLAEERR